MVIKIASGSNLEYSITDLYISLNLAQRYIYIIY